MRANSGIDALNRINEGILAVAPSEYLRKTRAKITTALTELIGTGARIRPLLVESQRIGWARGVFPSERRVLRRWIEDEMEYIEHLLLLGTSLPAEEIRSLSMAELYSLARVVREMTESDARLYGYIPAYVTTSESEMLWSGQGKAPAGFENRSVGLPDGKSLRLQCPSDHAALWAMLCDHRVTTKNWMAASENALLVARAMVGKGADSAVNDHKRRARELQTNNLDPWRESIRYEDARNFEDGWAHSEDSSAEGMSRELRGMIEEDRHERLMAEFERQQRERVEAEQTRGASRSSERLEALLDRSSNYSPLSAQELAEIAAQQPKAVFPVVGEEQSSVIERLAKYR